MVQDEKVEVVHDFGQGYGTKHFNPAVLRGKEEQVDGRMTTRPSIWGEERLTIELPRPNIAPLYDTPSISISRSTNRLAASYGELVSVYELPEWKMILVVGHPVAVDTVSWSPDGGTLLTKNAYTKGERKHELRIWDIDAEIARQEIEKERPSEQADMQKVQEHILQAAKGALLEYSQDWTHDSWMREACNFLAEGTSDLLSKLEKQHIAAKGKNVVVNGLDLSTFGTSPWSPDGTHLLLFREWEASRIPRGTNGKPGDVVIWDVKNNGEGMKLQQSSHDGPVMWVGYSPDAKWIASSSWDSKVRIWDAKTGRIHLILENGSASQSWTGRFSPDSLSLAVGSGDGNLRIWKVETGDLEHKVKVDNDNKLGGRWIRGIEFIKDSSSLFFSDGGGNAGVYSLDDKRLKQQYLVKGRRTFEMQEVQVSPDGKSLGFRIQGGQMVVYKSQTNEKWQVEQTLEADRSLRESAFGIMRFLDDKGKDVVSYDSDGILRVWKFTE